MTSTPHTPTPHTTTPDITTPSTTTPSTTASETTKPSSHERYETLARRFDAVVDTTAPSAWTNPSPCEGWSAADVVAHVVDSEREFLRRAGVPLEERPEVAADPVAGWRRHHDELSGLLADPAVADAAYTGMFGDTTVGAMLADFYGFDLIVHRNDIARAVGVADTFEEEELTMVERAADGFGDHLYGDGVCAAAVEVPRDASRQDRLLGRLGRDPRWRP